MTRFPASRLVGWLSVGFLSAALAQSCAADNAGDTGGPPSATGGGVSSDASGDQVVNPPMGGGNGGEPQYDPLCGVTTCVPDAPAACAVQARANESRSPGESAGGQAGASGAGAGGGDGGSSGESGAGGAGGESGGGSGGSGRAGESGDSGTGGGVVPPDATLSCQVVARSGEPSAECRVAGRGASSDPCLSGSDCAPGLACVREGEAGLCRSYCCAGTCPARTLCLERPLFGVGSGLRAPVCVPAVDCGLAEPFPCPEGTTCSCPDDLACMVVGDDGTTTCLRPGEGTEGQSCPCAWGHVCSRATNRCLKLCQTTNPGPDCGTCQVSPELPAGWGVCVGAPRPDAG